MKNLDEIPKNKSVELGKIPPGECFRFIESDVVYMVLAESHSAGVKCVNIITGVVLVLSSVEPVQPLNCAFKIL